MEMEKIKSLLFGVERHRTFDKWDDEERNALWKRELEVRDKMEIVLHFMEETNELVSALLSFRLLFPTSQKYDSTNEYVLAVEEEILDVCIFFEKIKLIYDLNATDYFYGDLEDVDQSSVEQLIESLLECSKAVSKCIRGTGPKSNVEYLMNNVYYEMAILVRDYNIDMGHIERLKQYKCNKLNKKLNKMNEYKEDQE